MNVKENQRSVKTIEVKIAFVFKKKKESDLEQVKLYFVLCYEKTLKMLKSVNFEDYKEIVNALKSFESC